MTEDDLKKLMLAIAEGLDKISEQLTALEGLQKSSVTMLTHMNERAWRESLDRQGR